MARAATAYTAAMSTAVSELARAAAAMIAHLDAVMTELLTLAHKQPEIFADRPAAPIKAAALAVEAEPKKRAQR